MKIVTDNRPKTTSFVLSTIITFLVILIVSPMSKADFDTIYFSVNGDTTATSMVQGDMFGWGSNCELGASINWEIYYDANSNAVIDKGFDVVLTAEQITDGDLLTEGTSVADGQVFLGLFELSLEPGTYIFRATDLATDSSIENSIVVTSMISPPNQLTGTISLPGVSAPSPLLENILVFAESDFTEGAFGAVTDQNGFYSIEIGAGGSGVEFYIDPGNKDNFVTPEGSSVIASGIVNNNDFNYATPVDSVYGFVNILSSPALLYESRIHAYSFNGEKSAITSNGRYVIYFTEAEKGDWSIGSDAQNSPMFVAINDIQFSHDTLGSFQQDINFYDANTSIFVIVTEDGIPAMNHYRFYVYSGFMNSYADAVSDTGTNYISEFPVSNLDGFGWQVSIQFWDDEFPIPMGYTAQPEYHFNVSPGDTVSFNIAAGCCIGYTGNIDNGPDDGSLGSIDINDLVYLVDFMFRGGATPICMEEGDINGGLDGIDINDLVNLVDYMFRGGPAPALCP